MLRIVISLYLLQCVIFVYLQRSGKEPKGKKMKKRGGKLEDDNYYNPNPGYEPYWPGGEWAQEPEKLPSGVSTTPEPTICGDECNYLYKRIGKICAHEVNTVIYKGCKYGCQWRGEGGRPGIDISQGFTTYDSYCEFLDAKCKAEASKKKEKWVFVHVGACVKNQNLTFKPMMIGQEPINRMHSYIAHVNAVFKNYSIKPCEDNPSYYKNRGG